MRHCLTDSEKVAVKALKEACDKEGVYYRHIFDLAKYVLVTHSMAKDSNPKAAQIRLKASLRRLKKRQAWLEKKGIKSLDARKAFCEFYSEYPEYINTSYATDKEGRVVVGMNQTKHPSSASQQMLAAELFRFDLGAADMDEARRGLCLVQVGEANLKMGYRYLLFLRGVKDLIHDMHSNRFKQILVELPPFLAMILEAAKVMLPAKIASRVHCEGSVHEVEQHLIPFGGDPMSANEWMEKRYAKYQETIEKLTIE